MVGYIQRFTLIILLCVSYACTTQTNKEEPKSKVPNTIDTPAVTQKTDRSIKTEQIDTINYDNATYYFVIVDTNLNYSILCHKMVNIGKKCHLTIDSIGRFYNKKKNLIILPENDEDELYAGNYFPRRYPSDFLSLEYLNFYSQNSTNKTIALMAGIFESEHSADSLLSILKPIEKKSYKLKAEIYIGCMH